MSLNLPGKEGHVLWKNILSYKPKEFPNIGLLAELMYCLSGLNSAVERGFSILTMIFSDRRLKKKKQCHGVVVITNYTTLFN